MKKIEIIVTPEGKISLHTKGFVGPACQDASRFVEQALGKRTGQRLTAAFHQSQAAHQVRHQQRG